MVEGAVPSALPTLAFCKSWIALVSLMSVRGLIVLFPFLKFLIAHSATLDFRERSFVENCLASERSSFRVGLSSLLAQKRPAIGKAHPGP
jgi:hypothetical protein